MKVILYSTNCPRCKILEKKLNIADITYTINNDADYMIEKGFTEAPMLEVDGKIMSFIPACDWINNLGR